MSFKNSSFGFNSCKFLIIDDEINNWAEKNNVFLIPFQNKNLKVIGRILEVAEYTCGKGPLWNGRAWEEKLKDASCPGKPDYFVFKYKGGSWKDYRLECYFVEYKSYGDVLHKNQLDWFRKYHKFPCMIIHSKSSAPHKVKHLSRDEKYIYSSLAFPTTLLNKHSQKTE